jgi:stage II sporulation protein M
VKDLIKLLKDSKYYVLLATLIFCLGSWLGYVFSDAFEALIQLMLDQLKDIVEELEKRQDVYYTAWFIFLNNSKAALMMIGLGAIFFIMPMISLFANGLAIGYIMKATSVSGVASPVDMFIFGILPHGILELPAILVAGGIGIFLGFRLLVWVVKLFMRLLGNDRGDPRALWEEEGKPVLLSRMKGVAFLIILLVITLFLAAAIEGFITPGLIERYVEINM